MSDRSCSRCGARTTEGYLLDRRQGVQAVVQQWIEGVPQRAWFGGLKLRDVAHGPIVARRCPKCGHLDLWVPKLEK